MIRLLKDKIVYTNQYNPEYEKYVKKEVPILSPYLNETVELSEDFTLEDFFKILEREKDVFDVVFSSHLGHYPLQLYIDDIKKPRPGKDEDEIEYLELRRYGERWDWGEIALFIDFSGIGKEHDAGNSYALEFTPLNELKHLPLCLSKNFEISEVKLPPKIITYFVRLLEKIHIPLGKLGKWGGYFPHVYVKGKAEFSVHEVIATILYEISFVGEPVERDAKFVEIGKDIEEMKDVMKDKLDKEK